MPVSTSDSRRADAHDRPPSPTSSRSRLWLDFVNTDAAAQAPNGDRFRDLDSLLSWLTEQATLDEERAAGIRRRALLQPAAAAATVVDARRIRGALRLLAERGLGSERICEESVAEINRVLGRSAGTRRLDKLGDGGYVRAFVPTGDAFAGLMIPIVESAADTLVIGELSRVRQCANARCYRVFLDTTKNQQRRWCDMGTCGNRAKAARHRAKSAARPARKRSRSAERG
ncbi:MAG: CGNR zinc finger domain-containing protein [Gemmatimonas sp.]